MSDDLPRFAASREWLRRYGDSWSSWAYLVTGAAFLGLLALAFADAADAPSGAVLPALLAFGIWAFVAGSHAGVLWVEMRIKARDREHLKGVDPDADVTFTHLTCPVCPEVLHNESGVLDEWAEHVEGHGLEIYRGDETA